MPNTTNRVKLPYILQSQSQKEVTHNSGLDLIDALLQAAMVSVGVALLTIASDSDKIWTGSTTAEKRELLNFVFANLSLKGANLCFTLKKPFDSMLDLSNCLKWRE